MRNKKKVVKKTKRVLRSSAKASKRPVAKRKPAKAKVVQELREQIKKEPVEPTERDCDGCRGCTNGQQGTQVDHRAVLAATDDCLKALKKFYTLGYRGFLFQMEGKNPTELVISGLLNSEESVEFGILSGNSLFVEAVRDRVIEFYVDWMLMTPSKVMQLMKQK